MEEETRGMHVPLPVLCSEWQVVLWKDLPSLCLETEN